MVLVTTQDRSTEITPVPVQIGPVTLHSHLFNNSYPPQCIQAFAFQAFLSPTKPVLVAHEDCASTDERPHPDNH